VQGGAGGNPQKVKIFDNSMTGNAIAGNKKGIVLTPHAGAVTNPNHSIDPPYQMHIDQAGKISGKIRILPNNPAVSGCAQPCTIQIFTTNPKTLDTQGRDKINTTVSIVPDSTDTNIGNFSALIGSVPAQLALTATDKDGNTSEFAVFTSTFGLDIGPARTGTALPGQVITYTHRITNTGTVDFTNIQFTGFSKLGWPFKLAPTSPITLLAGENKPVTVTLTLPTGSDPRVRAGLVEQTRLTSARRRQTQRWSQPRASPIPPPCLASSFWTRPSRAGAPAPARQARWSITRARSPTPAMSPARSR